MAFLLSTDCYWICGIKSIQRPPHNMGGKRWTEPGGAACVLFLLSFKSYLLSARNVGMARAPCHKWDWKTHNPQLGSTSCVPGLPKSLLYLRPPNPHNTLSSPFIEKEILHQATVQPWSRTQEDCTQRERRGEGEANLSEPP